ncbi:hypothetical protein OCU04_003792 [Sclerotinia nivalis]|uniref:Uncharacterized protein n=1 Tax=Sclerotinia nivalis TaxID=352851 RepID=A0A9X0DM60_9HELO|nr:hypothetical protein OCU04_003792 [Sclerotinia nivalis]
MSPTDENAATVKGKPWAGKCTHNPKVSRSVKARKKSFDIQVKEDGQIEIFFHEKMVSKCDLFKNALKWVHAWASRLERRIRMANLVYFATARLEDLISKENPPEKQTCRFCEDLSSCPLQSHNITSEKAPPKMKSIENSKEKKSEAASRDQFNADKLFEVHWRGAQTPI